MVKSKLKVAMAKKGIKSILKLQEDSVGNKDTLRRIATNSCKEIDVELLDRLCGYFDCQLNDLMEVVPDKADEKEKTE